MVTSLGDLDAFERWCRLLGRLGSLLRVAKGNVDMLSRAIFFVVKQGRLGLGPRVGYAHELGVTLCILLDQLQMRIARVLREPFDHIDAFLPIDGESIVVLVVDVVLRGVSTPKQV